MRGTGTERKLDKETEQDTANVILVGTDTNRHAIVALDTASDM